MLCPSLLRADPGTIPRCGGRDYPTATIVLAGDFNQLTDSAVNEQTGLVQIVQQPTRGANILDRLFVSSPAVYTTLRVVASTVRSDHRAIVAYSTPPPNCTAKTITTKSYRHITPTQHAMFLQYVSTAVYPPVNPSHSAQPAFDQFYDTALRILDYFYPIRTISVTSRDPDCHGAHQSHVAT